MNKDTEWLNILDNLTSQTSLTNYMETYFETMNNLVLEIKEHPYRILQNEENKKNIIYKLYTLGEYFYLYYIKLNQINKLENSVIEFPGAHNYFFKLNFNYFSIKILTNYYDLFIEDINIFIQSKAKTKPPYLHTIALDDFIIIYKLLNQDIINNNFFKTYDFEQLNIIKNNKLPKYYPINLKLGSIEKYEEIFKNNFKNYKISFQRFLYSEYPILKYIDIIEQKKEPSN